MGKKIPLGSSAVADGLVYFVGEDGHFYAVDVPTGKAKLRLSVNAGIASSPFVANGAVYFGADDGSLHILR